MLLQLNEAISATKDLSPYNAAAYGFVVLLLLVACYILYKQWKYWQDKYTHSVEKTVTLLNDVNKHLADNESTSQDLQDIKRVITEIQFDIRTIRK
jgi:predicted negative regulator of RcsB-dependent stress response